MQVIACRTPHVGARAAARRLVSCAVGALLGSGAWANARAADLTITPLFFSAHIGAADLTAGAGSEFASPVVTDAPLAILTIGGTGGANWELQVEMTSGDGLPLEGFDVAVRRAAGQSGITGGLSYRALSASPAAFFSGSGDHASVEILLRIAGVSVSRPPITCVPRLRYTLVLL